MCTDHIMANLLIGKKLGIDHVRFLAEQGWTFGRVLPIPGVEPDNDREEYLFATLGLGQYWTMSREVNDIPLFAITERILEQYRQDAGLLGILVMPLTPEMLLERLEA